MKLNRIIDAETLPGRKKYHVRLTEEERQAVERLTTTGRTSARTLRHAWVLLKSDAGADRPGWTDEEIRGAYGVSVNTISRIRQAFVEEGLDAALRGRPRRTPRPRKMDGEQEAHLVALLCGPAPEGYSRWSVRLLTDRFVHLDGRVAIARETVRRVLKKKRAQAVADQGVVYPPRSER